MGQVMNKKYTFTGKTITHLGRTLKQIKRISDGLIGGYIEKESNLSKYGNAWVYGNALVYGNARIYGDALVYGDAMVSGNANVSGDARVYGEAEVTTKCFNINYYQYNITMTDYHVKIGCLQMLAWEWLLVGVEDAVKMGLNRSEYPKLKELLNVIIPHHFSKELSNE